MDNFHPQTNPSVQQACVQSGSMQYSGTAGIARAAPEPVIPPPGPLEPVPPATVPEPTPAPTPTTVATAVNALPEECVACIADMIASQGCTLALEGVHNGVSCDACGGEGAGPILGTRYSRDLPEDEGTYDLCQEHYASLATKLKALYKATSPPAARPIGRKQVQEGLRDLQAMSAVYRPWHAAIMARQEALWKTLTLARFPRTMGIVREQGLPRSWKQLFWSQEMAERPPPRNPPAQLSDFTFTIESYGGRAPQHRQPYVGPLSTMPADCGGGELHGGIFYECNDDVSEDYNDNDEEATPRRWVGSFSNVGEMEATLCWDGDDTRVRVLVAYGPHGPACIYDGGEDQSPWRYDSRDMEEKELPCNEPLGRSEYSDRMTLHPRRSDGSVKLKFAVWNHVSEVAMTEAELVLYLTEGVPWELLAGGSTPGGSTPALNTGRAMREAEDDDYFDPMDMRGINFDDMLEEAEDDEALCALQTAIDGYESWLQKGRSDQEAADYFNGLLALARAPSKLTARAKLTDFVFTVEVFSRSEVMQSAFDRNRDPLLVEALFEDEEDDEAGARPTWAADDTPSYEAGMDDDWCEIVYPEKMIARWTGTFSHAKDMVRSYDRRVNGQSLPPHPVEHEYPKIWAAPPEWVQTMGEMYDTYQQRKRIFVTWRERTFCLHDGSLHADEGCSAQDLPCNMGAKDAYSDKAELHAAIGTQAYELGGEIVLGFAVYRGGWMSTWTPMTEAQILSYLTEGVPWQQVSP